MTRFRLATVTRYKNRQDNEWKERVQWHECVIYSARKRREFGEDPFQKNSHLLIEGELSYSTYDRSIETEAGPINVKWPVAEVVVQWLTRLN
jgi:single-stranded DNA-binding protein